jgi:two-component system sensor histidine kinase KdpD
MSASERQELVEAIEQETDHLDGLIGNLLDLSRLQAGVVTLNSQSNSLEEVAGDVAAYAFQRLKQERIRLAFPEDYPLVKFDYGLMLQALTNLVDNALRYEPADSQIELRGTLAGQEARLWVVNHGENISDDMRARLMEPFFRGKSGHIGLGLAIAKGIVEAHHGRLWVEDTPGSGATFVIALPLESEQVHDT